MIKVVGVRFRNAGKVYFFAPGDFDVKRGTPVIVETARGIEFGTCVNNPKDVTDDEIVSPLKPILRVATDRDVEQAAVNREKERTAFKTCSEKIREHDLDMKLIDAEYTFDNSKILFYFIADGRVDFRDLVKDLAGVFRTRIELRQVGVRDETKILGGIGICGRPLCCHSYLSDFAPVSIKMAKEQNLSLNPTKISGVCGKLMCCLKNEEEVYEEQNRKLPGVGDYVTTALGERGIVTNVNIFHETVKVLVQTGEDKELKEYKAEEIKFKKHRKRGRVELTPEEMEQLRALEPEDIAELGDSIEVIQEEKKTENPEEPVVNNNRNNNRGRGNRDPKENRDNRDNKENKDNRDNKENKDNRDSKENRENREHRDNREPRERRPNHDGKNKPVKSDNHGDGKPNRNRNHNRNRHGNHNHGGDRRPENNGAPKTE